MSLWSPDLFQNAFRFASEAHCGQTLPGSKVPYITHVAIVCAELMAVVDDSMDADLALQCAALHDVVEDTDISYEVIKREFGTPVADGVSSLSKDPCISKEHRLEESLARIMTQPREIWMVKLADRITNLAPPPASWSDNKKRQYRDQAIIIHERLGEANPELADRLMAKIENYRNYISR